MRSGGGATRRHFKGGGMNRRALLLALAPVAAAARDEKIPTDESELNEFAGKYNRYVADLRDGHIDLAQWRRVQRAWKKMTE